MTAEPEDAIEDNAARVIAIQALNQAEHRICQSTLMELIFAIKKWWGTCQEHLKKVKQWPLFMD
jgi:hypothetical protein